MKILFDKWWDKGNKNFSIIYYRDAWDKPTIDFHHNGAKKKNGDKCFDVSLIIGYTIFNYTNFNLQKTK